MRSAFFVDLTEQLALVAARCRYSRRSSDLVFLTYLVRNGVVVLQTRASTQQNITASRWLNAFIALTPAMLIVASDVSMRWSRVVSWSWRCGWCYLASIAISAVFWGTWLLWASARQRRWRRAHGLLLLLAFSAVFGTQRYFYGQYASYATQGAIELGIHVQRSVMNQVGADWFNALLTLAIPAAAALAVLVFASRRLGKRRDVGLTWLPAAALVVGVLAPPCPQPEQPASADHLLVHAVSRLIWSRLTGSHEEWKRPKLRAPIYLPRLRANPAIPRNVLLIIDESVRADAVCSVPSRGLCKTTPLMNRALPHRIGFQQLRSNDSTTAISLAVLWSGVPPTMSAKQWAETPLLFDFAHASGWTVGFVTSQDLSFASSRTLVSDLPLDVFAEAKDLVSSHNIDLGAPDEVTAAHAVRAMKALPEPFFFVVQFSNVHFPYRVDRDLSPFQPSSDSKDPKKVDAFINYYRNSVFLHDRAIAQLVSGVRALSSGARTVMLYTSDHGEAFREHHQLGHTLSTFDEEIHVPGWVDAPPGTLTASELVHLKEAARSFAWHVDIAPTILDLMGLYDEPGLQRYRKKMIGSSWLRGKTRRLVPLSNCAAMWGCAFNNWGVMRGPFKLEARAWDRSWRCYNVSTDPRERSDLGPDACGDLAVSADQLFGGLPHDAN